jgi:hypothetical protein
LGPRCPVCGLKGGISSMPAKKKARKKTAKKKTTKKKAAKKK